MAISKVIYKTSSQDTGTVWMDATPATAAAADITAPKTAMLADGVLTTGTGSGAGVYQEKTVTPNNTTQVITADEGGTTVLMSIDNVDGTMTTMSGDEARRWTETWSEAPVTGETYHITLNATRAYKGRTYSFDDDIVWTGFPFTLNPTVSPSGAGTETFTISSDYIYHHASDADTTFYLSISFEKRVPHYDALSQVTVTPIPSEYIVPTGTVQIDQNGTVDVSQYASANVSVSGGSVTVEEKDVNFIDYDGSIVASYTASDFASLSALPANPSHTGLTAQGWNWSLSDAKTYVASYGKLWVGQQYITDDGKTRIYIHLDDADYLSPYLAIAVNGTVVVDWGDNSNTDTMTGTSNTTLKYQQHIYASTGNYTIKLTVTSGGFAFYNSSSSYTSILRTINAADTRASSRVYSASINALRLGSGVNIGNYAFANCDDLQSITIPSTVTSIANSAFYNCRALMSITIPSDVANIDNTTFYECSAIRNISIPKSVTSIGNTVFYRCYGLTSVTIPSSVTSIGYSVFQYCFNLTSIMIPSSVTSIGSTTFQYCYKLLSITIPSTVTSIGSTAFSGCNSLQSIMIPSSVTSIDSSLFQNCDTLTSITIPSTVTSIGHTVFSNCYNLMIYHLLPTSVPTLGTSSISAKSGTIIYVPYSADHSILEAYKTATNWSTYASYMQEEPA